MSDQSIVTQGNYMSYRWGSRVAAFATEADRTLFEAAPNTLAALKALLEIMEDDHYKCDLHSDEDCDLTTEGGWHVKHHEMRLAKQAIDKATGREEEHVCDVGDKWCEEGANPARHPDHDSHVGGCNCPLGQKETA
jgi:hypothetical protein